jgi:hypothetical protein
MAARVGAAKLEVAARPACFHLLSEGINEPGLFVGFERRKGMKRLLHTLASDLTEDFKLGA